jgi:hypothetical protein
MIFFFLLERRIGRKLLELKILAFNTDLLENLKLVIK